jgi:hypothetical protein
MTTKQIQDIQNSLPQFTGSESFYRYQNSVLTDGAKFIADSCGAYWLLDIIVSVQLIAKVRAEYFQVYDLTVKQGKGVVVVTDGNENKIYQQKIPFTDFPLSKITLWRVDGTIMLPSEY